MINWWGVCSGRLKGGGGGVVGAAQLEKGGLRCGSLPRHIPTLNRNVSAYQPDSVTHLD